MINSINFCSKIKIISGKSFRKLPRQEMAKNTCYSGPPWEEEQIVTGKRVYTDGASDCSAGGITNGKQVVLFHLIPSYGVCHFDDIEKKLHKQIKLINTADKTLRAFISGGHTKSYENLSLSLYEKMTDFFNKNNIKFSTLWGQDKGVLGSTDICYFGKNDTWYVNSDKYNEIKDLDSLKNYYSKINIEDGDELIIANKNVDFEEVNDD